MKYDLCIVGCGPSGCVIAERAADAGKSVLIVEKRSHIAGNCYDEHSRNCVLVHRKGPHYFRTNSDKIVEYLSKFTEWQPTNYRVMALARGVMWDFPINLSTFKQMRGGSVDSRQMQEWVASQRVKIQNPANAEEQLYSTIGEELTEMFFRHYSERQWNCDLDELDASVVKRIPFSFDHDRRYFRDKFQSLPAEGYTAMFKRMIANERIKVLLQADFSEVREHVQWKHLVWTGPVDEFFQFCAGRLQYRSLRFEFEDLDYSSFQPAMQVNYCDKGVNFTRVVDYNYLMPFAQPRTTICREYPQDYFEGREAFYPLFTAESMAQYATYETLAKKQKNISFVGRLARWKYMNIDEAVGHALLEADRIVDELNRK